MYLNPVHLDKLGLQMYLFLVKSTISLVQLRVKTMLKNIKISNWCMGFRIMCGSINCSCFGVFGRDDNERNAWESLLNLSKFPQVNFIRFNSQIIALPVLFVIRMCFHLTYSFPSTI